MTKRLVLVVADATYYRNYTWDRGDEFVNDHPGGKVRRFPGRTLMTCDEFTHETLNSWDRCSIDIAYYRIASSASLRGIIGPVEVVYQEGYKPRNADEVHEYIRLINAVEVK